MKRLVVVPEGWPCSLSACRPGLFVFQDSVCVKTEYGDCDAFNEAGERFWGGANSVEERRSVTVQPVSCEWEESE